MKYLRRLIAVLGIMTSATAIAISPASTGSAFAQEPPDGIVWDHVWSRTGVKVLVEEHGDIVSVCDTKANGSSAKVELVDWDTVDLVYEFAARGGAGTCVTHGASDGGFWDLVEGHEFQVTFWDDISLGRSHEFFVNDH